LLLQNRLGRRTASSRLRSTRKVHLGGTRLGDGTLDLLFLLGLDNGDHVRKRFGRSLPALRVPPEHTIQVGTKHVSRDKGVDGAHKRQFI
jgi:hypothetical protein